MALVNILKIGSDGLPLEADKSTDSLGMLDFELASVSLTGTSGDTVLGTDKSQFTNISPAADTINSALLAIDSILGSEKDSLYDNFTNKELVAITIGEAVYLSGNDEVKLAINDDTAKDDAIGLVRDASIAADALGEFYTWGRSEGVLTGATAGAKYFLDDTAGALTTTVPATTGQNVLLMGYALNATDLMLRPQFIGRRA